jgi:hypothetical protein
VRPRSPTGSSYPSVGLDGVELDVLERRFVVVPDEPSDCPAAVGAGFPAVGAVRLLVGGSLAGVLADVLLGVFVVPAASARVTAGFVEARTVDDGAPAPDLATAGSLAGGRTAAEPLATSPTWAHRTSRLATSARASSTCRRRLTSCALAFFSAFSRRARSRLDCLPEAFPGSLLRLPDRPPSAMTPPSSGSARSIVRSPGRRDGVNPCPGEGTA